MISTKSRVPTLALQAFYMNQSFPQMKLESTRTMGRSVWRGPLRVFDFGIKYDVRISYEKGGRPRVHLIGSKFEPRPPHLFADNSLCLYHSEGKGAWSSNMSIAELIPRISHWIWCYEMWQVTGVWHGEEYPHQLNQPKDQN